MTCVYKPEDDDLLWYNGADKLAGKGRQKDGFNINSSTDGQFDLILNSAQPQNADYYSCMKDNSEKTVAQLIVFG